MKEDNSIFLKVDSIEPILKGGGICSRETYLDGVKVWIGNYGYFFPCDNYTVCYPDEVTKDGRRQAFDLFKELYDMTPRDRADAFGKVTMLDLVSKNTYEDVVEKLDTWKKEKETIRVRDEVYSEAYGIRFVITKIIVPSGGEDAFVNGLKKDGTAVKGLLLCNLKKTGLHVDDMDAYLEV